MNKLGYSSTPTSGDEIKISTPNGDLICGNVVAWNAEGWGQHWAVVKTSDGSETNVNMEQISAFSISKESRSLEVVKTELDSSGHPVLDDDGERVKSKRSIKTAGPNPKYKIVRRGSLLHAVSRSIPDGEKVVKEPEVSLDKDFLGKNPLDQNKTLVELYEEKHRLAQDGVKDHMTNEDLKETKEVYAMPSFEKRTEKET